MRVWRTKPLIAMGCAIAISFSFMAAPARAVDAPNPVPASFTLTGSGWGHGLGMSQYGAYGMALDGKKASEIIEHYYQGAKVAFEETPTKLRVGLLQDKKYVAIRGEKNPDKSSGGTLTLWVDGVKQESTVAVNKTIVFETVTGDGKVETKVTSGDKKIAQGSKIIVKWSNTNSLVNLGSGSSAQTAITQLGTVLCIRNALPALDKCPHRYRYGYLEVTSGSIGAKDSTVDLNVVNVLRLSDQYLYGLGEMPSSWHIEALKTQVIAARSFALIKSLKTQSYCDCNLDTTDGSQVFSGFSKEFASYGDKWKQAVNETIGTTGSTQAQKAAQGQVIKNGSEIISGFYSSSTGGKTQPRSEVWGTGTISWLVSVDDKWSQDPRVRNPYANWVDSISQETLVKNLKAKKIEIPDVAAIEVSASYTSGGVKELKIRDSAGNVYLVSVGPGKDVTPDGLRGMLGVRSTYISKIEPVTTTIPGSEESEVRPLSSVTRVNWPTKVIAPITYEFKGRVSPIQFGAEVKLQHFVSGKWRTIAKTQTNGNGSWSVEWENPNAGKYQVRIAATNKKGTVKTSATKISVAGKLKLTVPASAKKGKKATISGAVSPATPGVKVTLERKIGNGKWKKITSVTTDANGKWSTVRTMPKTASKVYFRVNISHDKLGKLKSSVKSLVVK